MTIELHNTLIVMVGLPRSGKSTWAREQGSWPIVCPDEIRLAIHGQRFIAEAEPYVWAIAHTMVTALFGAGHRFVILDACNTTRNRRDDWISPAWVTKFRPITTNETICMDRAEAAGDVVICPIIASMAKNFEPLQENEVAFL